MTSPAGLRPGRELRLDLGGGRSVGALLTVPSDMPSAVFSFAHGAGAGMRHPFMESVAGRLAARGIATLRYHFPYMERGRKAPDRPGVLVDTVRAATGKAADLVPGVTLVAGGKSMGGRMTSLAQADHAIRGVRGLAFFGFPLHAAGRMSSDRGAHLARVGLPMLFLQGTRDKLADLGLLRAVLGGVSPAPVLHVLEAADHGFHVLKRSGRTDEEVLDEACDAFSEWVAALD